MPLLRAIYGRRTTFGVLTASWPCGIICGMETLYEWEGMVEVDNALKTLFADESRRPAVLFYDNACGYDSYLNARNDQFWSNTHLVVDRCVTAYPGRAQFRTFQMPPWIGVPNPNFPSIISTLLLHPTRRLGFQLPNSSPSRVSQPLPSSSPSA